MAIHSVNQEEILKRWSGMTKKLGTHLLIELTGCNYLNDESVIEYAMIQAAISSGATILSKHFHKFQPQGVSGAIIIAESHLTIHTWPEYGYASIDVYTCGDTCKPYDAAETLSKLLEADRMEIREYIRGF